MKTANELKTGIFASEAILLRGVGYSAPTALPADPPEDFGKGGPGSGRHKEGTSEHHDYMADKHTRLSGKSPNGQREHEQAAAAHDKAAEAVRSRNASAKLSSRAYELSAKLGVK